MQRYRNPYALAGVYFETTSLTRPSEVENAYTL
jgi:hypothetical protein